MKKEINWESVEVDGIDTRDYPDFVDAYACYAEFNDGTQLNDDELDELGCKYSEILYDIVFEKAIGF